jgi:subtilisin family serine protease
MTTYIVPNDNHINSLWGMIKISAPQAWDTFVGDSSIVTCVIDSGIDASHNDLASNIVSTGYNAITNQNGAYDDNGHGTHCAGTIAATGNNTIGVAGVVWSTHLIGCKFLDLNGRGYTSDAIKCIQYCRSQGAKITSNSWGGGGYSQALYDEIQYERQVGNLFIVAAGNANVNIDSTPTYPANYNLDNIISVGASTSNDVKSTYSNFGVLNVDLSAPGDGILSTIPGQSYAFYSGTSMATPHVSGAACLLWQLNKTLTYLQVKEILMGSVDVIQGLVGYSVTGGRLNVSRALEQIIYGNDPPTIQPPVCCKYNKKNMCIKWC